MKAAALRLGAQGVPVSYDDHLLIIGDAAGHIDPLTGEGIHTAMMVSAPRHRCRIQRLTHSLPVVALTFITRAGPLLRPDAGLEHLSSSLSLPPFPPLRRCLYHVLTLLTYLG